MATSESGVSYGFYMGGLQHGWSPALEIGTEVISDSRESHESYESSEPPPSPRLSSQPRIRAAKLDRQHKSKSVFNVTQVAQEQPDGCFPIGANSKSSKSTVDLSTHDAEERQRYLITDEKKKKKKKDKKKSRTSISQGLLDLITVGDPATSGDNKQIRSFANLQAEDVTTICDDIKKKEDHGDTKEQRVPPDHGDTKEQRVPPIPDGKTLLEMDLPWGVDRVFELLFTPSAFYYQFQKSRTSEGVKNIVLTEWKKVNDEEDDETEEARSVTYDTTRIILLSTYTIHVNQNQTKLGYSRPGAVYGVDVKTVNTGPPSSDSFEIKEHFRILAKGPDKANLTVTATINFVKSAFFKGKIEAETWAGLKKYYEILEQEFGKAGEDSTETSSTNATDLTDGSYKSDKDDNKMNQSSHQAEQLQLKYPMIDAQIKTQLILLAILLVLCLLVFSLFKLSWTLEKMDERLSNLETAFALYNITHTRNR